MAFTFLIAAHVRLWFWLVAKPALVTHPCSSCC